MSGNSYQETCPICGVHLDAHEDRRPFPQVSGECVNCGFIYYTKAERMTFEGLNEARELYNSDYAYDLNDTDFLPPVSQEDYDRYTETYVEVIE